MPQACWQVGTGRRAPEPCARRPAHALHPRRRGGLGGAGGVLRTGPMWANGRVVFMLAVVLSAALVGLWSGLFATLLGVAASLTIGWQWRPFYPRAVARYRRDRSLVQGHVLPPDDINNPSQDEIPNLMPPATPRARMPASRVEAQRMPGYPILPISSSSARHSAAALSSAGSGPLVTSSSAGLRGSRQPFTNP